MSRGMIWLRALTNSIPNLPQSVLAADSTLGEELVRYLVVVPNLNAKFPRSRNGEVGLEEGWMLAKYIQQAIAEDRTSTKRPIVAIVDVPSQAFGRREEVLGIHLACAAASDAYTAARLQGHPVVALIVGHALSGGFLAHGYQANQILAINDPEVTVHAMGKVAAARVTRRSVDELDRLGETILPLAYDIASYSRLGVLQKLIDGINADNPTKSDIERIKRELMDAIAAARSGPKDLSNRLAGTDARQNRAASIKVRELLKKAW
jgi:malonate decarboxylase gamma subunit